jgi:Xaa-Pro aminopeptidase
MNVRLIAALAAVLVFSSAILAQEFNKDEFANRRGRLLGTTNDGVTIIVGATEHVYPLRFRQTPDFYYLTGIEEPASVLVLVGDTLAATVFVPELHPMQVMYEGPGPLQDTGAGEVYGVSFRPLSELTAFLEQALESRNRIYTTVRPPDRVQAGRDEVMMRQYLMAQHPLLGERPTEYDFALESIKAIKSGVEIADISHTLDSLRWAKSPYEAELLRESGRIAARAFVETMRATSPGMFEYQLEAKARYVMQSHGAGDAFMPIVASGPNTLTIHYVENDRVIEEGDVILMDYGADHEYYTSDVTRMWPASGTFTELQERMYNCILEASKAMIAAVKPGIMLEDLKKIGDEVYERHGFTEEYQSWNRYVGHAVGLSVHDPSPGGWGSNPGAPFEVGTVFNIEPVLTLEKAGIHMRLEDTILVTEDGAENLTAGVPVELEEIYTLVGSSVVSSEEAGSE